MKSWINTTVAEQWGKRAACRIYHICQAGYDVTLIGPFSPGDATEKPVKQAQQVPGAASPARSLYDVSQALSWVATGRANAEERLAWQADIPKLLQELQASLS